MLATVVAAPLEHVIFKQIIDRFMAELGRAGWLGFVTLSSAFLHAPAPPRVPIAFPESKKQTMECPFLFLFWNMENGISFLKRKTWDSFAPVVLFLLASSLAYLAHIPGFGPAPVFEVGDICLRWNIASIIDGMMQHCSPWKWQRRGGRCWGTASRRRQLFFAIVGSTLS